jgi:hypothetical protein
MDSVSESNVYVWCRQSRVKQDRKCVYGGDRVWDWFSFYIERMRVFILLRDRENNHHSWSPTPLPHCRCPCQAMQTSSYRELHPTSQDSGSNNSNRHSHPDAMPGVQLNDQYLKRWLLIAECCAGQGSKEQSRSQVRVDCNGPDLPVVSM